MPHRFLDARNPVQISLRAGTDTASFFLDHDSELPIHLTFDGIVDARDSITARFQGAALVVDSLVGFPALTVGTSASPAPIRLSPARAGAGTTHTEQAFVAPAGEPGQVAWEGARREAAVSGVSLWIHARRVVPAPVWTMVEQSHRNTLAWEALAEADRRTLVRSEEAP